MTDRRTQRLGHCLRAARLRAGMSLDDLAARLGIKAAELSLVEHGMLARVLDAVRDRADAALPGWHQKPD